MGNLVIGGFGVSPSGSPRVVIYGLGLDKLPNLQPISGTIRGGDQFVISGAGISNLNYYDRFNGPLNTTNWTPDVDNGTVVGTADGLALTASMGGYASIKHNKLVGGCDVSVAYFNDKKVRRLNPTSRVVFCCLRLSINSGSYAEVAHIWDPIRGPLVVGSVYVDNVLQASQFITGDSTFRTIRLVRFGGRVQLWVGNTLLMNFVGWMDDVGELSISIENTNTTTPLQSIIKSFVPNALVTFGSELATHTQQPNANIIMGTTPAVMSPTTIPVGITAFGLDIQYTLQQFTYEAPLQLTVSHNGGDGSIVVTNDDTLRDTSTDLPGLRL